MITKQELMQIIADTLKSENNSDPWQVVTDRVNAHFEREKAEMLVEMSFELNRVLVRRLK